MNTLPDISISVVTYNSAACLPELLVSIRRQTGVRWELHIADNASTDGTGELLRGIADARCRYNERNEGFARAQNQNAQASQGRHVLVLNPDVTFADGLFAALVGSLDADPRSGAAAPSILEGGRSYEPCRYYPGEGMVPLEPDLDRTEYRWAGGSCLAVRREAWEQIRGFDGRYFLYGEDADIGLRLRRAGWKILWNAQAAVMHSVAGSQSAGSYERACRVWEGRARFYESHYAPQAVRGMMRWQLALSGVLWPFTRASGDVYDRRNREWVRARRDVARGWLERAGVHTWPVDGYTPRIAARHCLLAWRWLRSGRFPLDSY